ncbi:MAG: methyltransferase [Bryobacteraceae bacterium]|jgi:SAM-dependent methyltransferase
MLTPHTSFDQRIVRYEDIHSIQPNDFIALVDAARIHVGNRILDCGCGYGAVAREVLLATEDERLNGSANLVIDLIDESAVQLERAKHELALWIQTPGVTLTFIKGTFPQDLIPGSSHYDAIFCKMVLHEIPKDQQLSFLASIHECLKIGGRFAFWDVCLSDDIAEFYRAVVRMKDALAGYETMAERRNFLTEGELCSLFAASPFGHFQLVKDIAYRFDTQKRLLPEFRGDEARFDEWQNFIRRSAANLSSAALAGLQYHDDGHSISFNVRKVIAAATRVQETS